MFDDEGVIDDRMVMVMVRPLSGADAPAEAMGARFERITLEAQGGWRRTTEDGSQPIFQD